jgi:hypothetical protein
MTVILYVRAMEKVMSDVFTFDATGGRYQVANFAPYDWGVMDTMHMIRCEFLSRRTRERAIVDAEGLNKLYASVAKAKGKLRWGDTQGSDPADVSATGCHR